MIFVDKASIGGVMVIFMRVSGKIAKCKVKENTHGRMEEYMKGSILMEKNKASATFIGAMGELTLAIGTMVICMVKDHTLMRIIIREKGFGRKEF
eukprot:CAMPEP_0117013252 /NCGR_PEP_ID=MMETSP0472-20121206/10976_1 /TAXON_ID=693140 ORGANISM="Tiarina fusus, Strain LIS" /NCGR_SAMPLE_ID=MMETSP0472 /ASSEMBLY_ACC=CAM_ASM_000603 /LENGTH=94 /DNA_ID=CAMNT_0004716523 /DNA_START=250 /DNA_END=537 /DNA_ORIENTATION=+